MSRTEFGSLLASREWLLADGATGTNLFAMGLESGEPPEFWTTERPDDIRALHQGFVDAGSDIILTNTFGCNRHRLKLHGAEARVPELNEKAAAIACGVAEAADRPVVVAGSVGPTGEIFEPAGTLPYEEGVEAFAEQIAALAEGGVDVIWIETMSAEEEVRAAVEAARRVAPGLPVVATMSFDTAGRTMMGVTPARCVELGRELGLDGVGSNCGTGAPDLLAGILEMTAADPEFVVVAKANAGVPEFVDGEIHYSGTVEMAGTYARMALDAGARIIGGCCGNTFEHVKAMHDALAGYGGGPRPTVEEIVERLGPLTQGGRQGGCGHGCSHGSGDGEEGGGGRSRRRRRRRG